MGLRCWLEASTTLLLACLLSPLAAGAVDTLSCGYRPAFSVRDISIHRTFTATIAGHTVVTAYPSPDGPWAGHVRIRILLPDSAVWHDGRTFHAVSGPSAVSWREGNGAGADVYAVDRMNGDFYHWQGGRIVAGGRCEGTPFPL